MDNYVQFSISFDDGAAELSAQFRAGAFSGKGCAYFDRIVLVDKVRNFDTYPIQADQFPCIEGGYRSPDDITMITQEHLHLSVHPTDRVGNLGLLIRGAAPFQDQSMTGLQSSASVEFSITYDDLTRLAARLLSLASGEIQEFTFHLPSRGS